jgi:hypothetical protein
LDIVSAVKERDRLDMPVVNEKTSGRVVYDRGLLALLATAGASEALDRDRAAGALAFVGSSGAPSIGFAGLPGGITSGRLGERYVVIGGSGLVSEAENVAAEGFSTLVRSPEHFLTSNAVAGYTVGLAEEHLPSAVVAPVNVDPIALYRRARQSAKRASENALGDIRRRLDSAKSEHAKASPRDVVGFLGQDLGVGQLTTARAVGVSPTAVRKWRRGEAAKPEHRSRLASFAALSSLLMEVGLHDPAGWIDIRISDQSTLTPLDLFVGGRGDLAVLLGARLADPQEALDAFDPAWRENYAPDPDYEVITLADGTRSAVPRRTADRT